MSPTVRTLVADRGDAGVRLDRVLRRHLGDVQAATRTRVQAWIADGYVTVNDRPVRRAAARAALGDRVAVTLPEAPPRRAMDGEDVALDVLYEDDHLIAVDKPAGMVVHPAFRHPAGTLMNALVGRARAWPAGQRPSIVGRLDKLTSGIVVVAKTAAMHAALQRAWVRDAKKDYLAVVYGEVSEPCGTIELRLRHDPIDRRMMVVASGVEAGRGVAHDGISSITRFERLASVSAPQTGLSLLRCRLVTGRRHQIRVHLAARGWPIVGDPQYGEPRWSQIDDGALAAALQAFPRQALHAWRVAFTHPISRQRVAIEAPVPRDLEGLIKAVNWVIG